MLIYTVLQEEKILQAITAQLQFSLWQSRRMTTIRARSWNRIYHVNYANFALNRSKSILSRNAILAAFDNWCMHEL